MEAINALIEAICWLLLIFTLSRIITDWLMKKLQPNIAEELNGVISDLETEKLIPLTVEVDGSIFLCYNSLTNDFVCQGTTLSEISQNFKLRYPDKEAALYKGDKQVIAILNSQIKDLHESSSSIRYTSGIR